MERRARPRSAALEPMRHAEFSSCFVAGTIAHSANWMQTIAVPFLVFDMTGSNTWLGIAALAGQAPSLVGAPVGGILADRYSRRLVLIATNLIKASVALALGWLWYADALTPLRIVALLTVTGFASSVNITCWQSFVAQIVPETSLAAAFRLNAIQFNFSRAIGPAIAGWVLAQFGPGVAFVGTALAYAPFTLTVALARPRRLTPAIRQGPLQEFWAGLVTVLAHPGLWLPVVTAGLLSMLGQGLHQLMAGLASEVFQVGAAGFGGLMSSVGVASVLTAIGVVFLADRVTRSALARVGLFVYAAGVLTVGATSSYTVGLIGFGITGVAHVMVHISSTTAIQLHVSDELRGRVTSIYLTAIIGLIPVGALVGGRIGDWFGLPVVVLSFGTAIGLYAVVAWMRLDGLRPLDGDRPLT